MVAMVAMVERFGRSDIRSAGLLQNGRSGSHRFSCFASTKRPFVTSHTRPGDGGDRQLPGTSSRRVGAGNERTVAARVGEHRWATQSSPRRRRRSTGTRHQPVARGYRRPEHQKQSAFGRHEARGRGDQLGTGFIGQRQTSRVVGLNPKSLQSKRLARVFHRAHSESICDCRLQRPHSESRPTVLAPPVAAPAPPRRQGKVRLNDLSSAGPG
jgi:hypothetical protein